MVPKKHLESSTMEWLRLETCNALSLKNARPIRDGTPLYTIILVALDSDQTANPSNPTSIAADNLVRLVHFKPPQHLSSANNTRIIIPLIKHIYIY